MEKKSPNNTVDPPGNPADALPDHPPPSVEVPPPKSSVKPPEPSRSPVETPRTEAPTPPSASTTPRDAAPPVSPSPKPGVPAPEPANRPTPADVPAKPNLPPRPLDLPSKPETGHDIRTVLQATLDNTQSVIDNRIRVLELRIADISKKMEEFSVGKIADHIIKRSGLFGNTILYTEIDEVIQGQKALKGLNELRDQLLTLKRSPSFSASPQQSLEVVGKIRSQLGLPPVPMNFMADNEGQTRARSKEWRNRDKSLEVNNAELADVLHASGILVDAYETYLNIIDGGTEFLAGLDPTGQASIVYAIARNCPAILTGEMTPAQAGEKIVWSILFGKLGGKFLGPIGEKLAASFVGKEGKRLAKYLSKETCAKILALAKDQAQNILEATIQVCINAKTPREAIESLVLKMITNPVLKAVYGDKLGDWLVQQVRKHCSKFRMTPDKAAEIAAVFVEKVKETIMSSAKDLAKKVA